MEKIFTLCFHLFLLFISDADPLKLIAGDRSVVKKDGATHTISKYYVVPKNYDPNNATNNTSVSQKTALHMRSLYSKSAGSGTIGGEITKDKAKTVSDQSDSEFAAGTINTPIDKRSQLKMEQGVENQNEDATESTVSVRAIPILDSHNLETDGKDASDSSELEVTQRRETGEEDDVNDLVTLSAIPVSNQETVSNADVLRSQVQIKRGPETEHTISDTTETAENKDNLLESLDQRFTGAVPPGMIIDSRTNKKLPWHNNPRSIESSEIPTWTIQDKGSFTSTVTDDLPWHIDDKTSVPPFMIKQRQSHKNPWNIEGSEIPAWTIQDKGSFTSTPADDLPWHIDDKTSVPPFMIKQRQSDKNQWNIDSEIPAWTIQDKGSFSSTPTDDLPWHIDDKTSVPPFMIKQRQSHKNQWNIDSEIPAWTIQDKGSFTSTPTDDLPWHIDDKASVSPFMIKQRQSHKNPWKIEGSEIPAWTIQDKGSFTSTPTNDLPWYIDDKTSVPPFMIKQRQSHQNPWNTEGSEVPTWTIQDKGSFTSTPTDDLPWHIDDKTSVPPFMIKQRQSHKNPWSIEGSEIPAWTIQDKGSFTSTPTDDLPWYIDDKTNVPPFMIKQRQSHQNPWNTEGSEVPTWTIQDNGSFTSTPTGDLPWYIDDKASFPSYKISQNSAYFGPWNINRGFPTWSSGPGGKLFINPNQIKKSIVHSVKNGIKKPFHIYTYVINPSKITYEVPNAINFQTKLFGLPISHGGNQVFYKNQPSQSYYEPQINLGQSSVKNTNYITRQEDNNPLYLVGPGSELEPKPALVLPNSDDVGNPYNLIHQNSHPPVTNTASAHSSVQINQPNGLISSSASSSANTQQPGSFSTASAHSFIEPAPVYEGNYPGLVHPIGVYNDAEPAPAYEGDLNIQPGFISKATAHTTYTNVPNHYDVNNVYEENHVSKNVDVYQNPVYPNVVNEQNYPGYISKDTYTENILPNTYNIPTNEYEKEIDVTQSSLIKQIPSTEHLKLAPTYRLLTLINLQKLRNAVIKTMQLYGPGVYNGKALINLNKILEVILILAESFEETDRINPWYERIFYNSRLNEHPLQLYVYHLIRQRWLHELMLLLYKNNFSVNILQNPSIFSFLETWQIPNNVQNFLETWESTHVLYPNGYNKDTKFITHTFDDVIEELPKDLEEYVTKSVIDSYKSSNDIVLSIAGVEAEPDASAIIHMLQEYLNHKTVIEKQQNVLIGDNKVEMLKHIVLFLRQKGYDSTTIANLIKKLYSAVYSVEGDCHTLRPDFAKSMYNVIVPVLRRSG